jgi:hypothetical protein
VIFVTSTGRHWCLESLHGEAATLLPRCPGINSAHWTRAWNLSPSNLVHQSRANMHGKLTVVDPRRQANCLDEFQEALLDAYQRRTGLPRQELRELMARDVWMNAERAVELRFCDRVVPRPRTDDECPALHCARTCTPASASRFHWPP